MMRTASHERHADRLSRLGITSQPPCPPVIGVIERHQYAPNFARTVLNAGGGDGLSDVGSLHGHQRKRHDLATGLVSFRNREYSPALGRWTRQDPVGYVDGASLYQYLFSNPGRWSDPEGLAATRPASGPAATRPAGVAINVIGVTKEWPHGAGNKAAAEMDIRWVVPGQVKGAIIQHVTYEWYAWDSEDDFIEITPLPGNKNVYEYWEAWIVDQGRILVGWNGPRDGGGRLGNITNDAYHDRFGIGRLSIKDSRMVQVDNKPVIRGCRGWYEIRGEAAFFDGYLISGNEWGTIPKVARDLPAREAAPQVWNQKGATADHWLRVSWDFRGDRREVLIESSR